MKRKECCRTATNYGQARINVVCSACISSRTCLYVLIEPWSPPHSVKELGRFQKLDLSPLLGLLEVFLPQVGLETECLDEQCFHISDLSAGIRSGTESQCH